MLMAPASNPANIVRVAQLLRAGGVAVIPTDTVYGLAADIFQPEAVRRVLAIKGRNAGAALPVLLATASDLSLVARRVPRDAWHLIQRFWPGPLTLVLPALPALDPAITAAGSTVALRVPAGRSCLELLTACGTPLTGTSANISGRAAAKTAAQAAEELGGVVDAILEDDASVTVGAASTIVEVTSTGWELLRQGPIGAQEITQALSPRTGTAGDRSGRRAM